MTENIPKIKIKFDNREYLWDGAKWIDLKNYMIPPDIIIQQLNKKLAM